MKNINKSIALLLISLLGIVNTFAEGFPDEPMVIYGNVSGGGEGKTLKIYDGENNLLKQIQISSSKYGTNKTFDIDNKIVLEPFSGKLAFSVDGYNYKSTALGETNSCNTDSVFQTGNICQYNITISRISTGGSGGGGGGSSSSSSSSSSSNTTTQTSTNDTGENDTEKETSGKNENQEGDSKVSKESDNVKRNEEGKIVIKSKDYARTLKMFIKNKKEEKTVLGKKVFTVKGDSAYNKNVETKVKKIHKEILLDGIRKSMIKNLDRLTTTYGIYTDPNLDPELKETYKAKLKEDMEYFELKLKKLKRKDLIIRTTLEKRKQK